jgi:glycosyltransferase involved in cell wall biosynthesis
MVKPIDQYTLRNSSIIIVISDQMKNYLIDIRKINESKIHVIRNWQNEKEFREIKYNKNYVNDIFTFMYLGSINSSAGLELLIYSFAKTNILNARLIIAGDGSELEKCKEIAKNYPSHNIEFWGTPINSAPEIQSKADVLLLPLKKGISITATPSKLIAYMFSSKPIIACVEINSDTANIISNSNCGWIIEPESIEKLSSKMCEVATQDKKELVEIGKNGFNFAMEQFSKEKNLPKIVEIINGL